MTLRMNRFAEATKPSTPHRIVNIAGDLKAVLNSVNRIPREDYGTAEDNLDKINELLSQAHSLLFSTAADYQMYGEEL